MMRGTMQALTSLAAHSGLSPRTLQRHLTESNPSFQRLQRKVLRDASDDVPARGTTTQGEIAFLPGCPEESAFSRAYRS
jgi:AraC-like DNA-binding protein